MTFGRLIPAICSIAVLLISACASNTLSQLPSAKIYEPKTQSVDQYRYLIGPGDNISIFVWRNPELSTSVIVRPDGRITTPLVEDLAATGKTPSELARSLEKALSAYIKEPLVTVSIGNFSGPANERIRIIGEAAKPQSLPYREQLSLLDVMIAVNGLTPFADGNGAILVRQENGQQQKYKVRLADLIQDGDISANVDLLPGDILIIPEALF